MALSHFVVESHEYEYVLYNTIAVCPTRSKFGKTRNDVELNETRPFLPIQEKGEEIGRHHRLE